MRRTPLARKTPLRSTSTLTRRTPLRASRTSDERHQAVLVAFERHGHRCFAEHLVPSVACAGPLAGHEPLTRARGGDAEDPDQIVPLCRAHHEFTHSMQDEAHRLGLLKHSWSDR